MAGTDETDSAASAAVPPGDQAPAAEPAPVKKATRKPKAAAADPEALAADIEKTREELAETLDAIAEKVSPKRVAKRTTKKVGDTVKGTAHDAAAAVKETAGNARDKVLHTDDAAHPVPLPAAATTSAATPATTATTPWSTPATSTGPAPAVSPYAAPPSLLRPEYLAAGAAAALLAWLLVRRRR